MRKIFKIVYNCITVFLVIILIFVVSQRVTKNKIVIGDTYIFQIASQSMTPEFRIGDVIISKKMPLEELSIGDDITYLGKSRDLKGLTITHRIVDIKEKEDNTYITTKGIANDVEDSEITIDDVYGKVIYKSVVFSFFGRIMQNQIVYYFIFIFVGVSFSYEFIMKFILKDDEEDAEEE